MWTIETVKRDLPNVAVDIGEDVVTGRLSGRMNDFATVTIFDCFRNGSNRQWSDYQFSWRTIVESLNNGTPLLL